MGHEENIIKELDFVLTHPACSVSNIENFYNQCLYVYESVPLLLIIGHMQKSNPKLLMEWSNRNVTVRSLLADLEPGVVNNSSPPKMIKISIDLSKKTAAKKGIYQITWETNISDAHINSHFKKKSMIVTDKSDGLVDLIGISLIEEYKYNLYVKKRRK